jgi:hypothetical protein
VTNIIDFIQLRGYTFEDKKGNIVKVYNKHGGTPPRRIILRALIMAHRKLRGEHK